MAPEIQILSLPPKKFMNSSAEDIKSRINIVDFIGEYVKLNGMRQNRSKDWADND